ncbi:MULTISPECIES: phosphoenolpyruvate synthase [unclassified Thermoactinomyces]|jgi:phosphoenolpyruvate synthase/pyruvate phosphate dikinase|uniref:phosphoenolpyruvate synthase n=1 Tax=unclassified Thermoactinomyces TaxID=2634588 RepID=UPI001E52F48C|nr:MULTISPECIES: phosphoenolpyruvate synthase [unclassified Thermoactinomyces]
MSYVLRFDEIDRHCLPMVGGKGANLGEMAKAGFPVPPGFCVTTEAYRQFIAKSGELDEWLDALNRLKPEQLDEIRMWGERIRNHLLELPLTEEIQSAIVGAWEALGKEHAYAVRSSATAEDLPTASFAGQQETYLNVKGEEALLDAVKKCWASLFTDRAITYRANNGFDHRSVFLSVVVQQMVFPEASGIMFTADPVTGHRRTVSIDAGFGLGEALVSGIVTADLYKVRDYEIIQKQIAKKEKGVFPVQEGGTEIRELPPELRQEQVLPDHKILELAELGRRIENHYGSEQDIEWCLKGDELYILQSRPITSLYPVPPSKNGEYCVYLSVGHSQMMTDYMKPLGISVFQSLISLDDVTSQFPEVGGRLYWNCSGFLFLKPVQRKILKSTVADDNLVALKKVIQSEDFQKLAPKRGGMRKAFGTLKLMLGLYRKIIPRLIQIWYWEDPQLALKKAFATYEQDLARFRQALSQRTGSERIRLIRDQAVFETIVDPLAYTYAGFIALPVINRKLKKWLGEELSPSIQKSPPGNITSEMGLAIGDLADAARPYPEVVRYLEQAEDRTFYEGLSRVEGGDAFRAELERFMERFGMRAPGEIDITRVRYREAPTMLVPSILSHMRSNAPGEHREKFKNGEREAHEAIQDLLKRVKERCGNRKAKKMSRLISLYRNTVGIRELPKYIMIRYFSLYRETILEEAQTLVKKGVFEQKEDVYYLRLDELIALLEDRLKKDEVHERIRSRKASEEIYRKLTPPFVITSEGETFSAVIRNEQAPPGALVGIPASAGVAEGYVKVVRRLEEGKLNKGDILVAPYTDPGWTPLFHSAKALVTEVGGMMTHGSVVAREYGIPAVVSVENATRILKDGQYVRVDGTNGYVEILDENN